MPRGITSSSRAGSTRRKEGSMFQTPVDPPVVPVVSPASTSTPTVPARIEEPPAALPGLVRAERSEPERSDGERSGARPTPVTPPPQAPGTAPAPEAAPDTADQL